MAGERLNGLDVAFLSIDTPSAPMNIGVLAVFRPPEMVDGSQLRRLLVSRAARIPGLRRRARSTWLPPGAVEWVEDRAFDPDAHIRLTGLTRPGTRAQLSDQVARAVAAPLDRDRPLWELRVFTGLADGAFACLLKVHHAFADGVGMFLLTSAMFDGLAPVDPPAPVKEAKSTARDQLLAAVRSAAQPARWVEHAAGLTGGALTRGSRAARRTAQGLGITASVLRAARWFHASSPLVGERSSAAPRRQLTTVQLDVKQLKRVREQYGATVNDVLLAVFAGALREWSLARGERVGKLAPQVLIPVTLPGRNGSSSGTNEISGYLCALPVTEADPVRRLRAVQAVMNRNKAGGPYGGPGALPLLARMMPAQAHRLTGPLLAHQARLLFDIVVTNVPMPKMPLSLSGAPLAEIYPLVPLANGHGLGIAVSTHQEGIGVGLHSDPAIIPDIATLAHAIPEALAALDARPMVPAQRTKSSTRQRAGTGNGQVKDSRPGAARSRPSGQNRPQ